MRQRGVKSFETWLLPLVTAAALLGIWYLSVRWSGTRVFPSPLDVASGLIELSRKGVLLGYVRDSLLRVLAGYSLALVLGIPLGLLMGWYRGLGDAVNPLLQALRPISPLAWIPLAIAWFGVSDAAPVFLIFLASFFPIVLATHQGALGVSPAFLLSARNFGLSPAAILIRVAFPAALPSVLVGLRIALGIAWLVVVAAEMIAVDSGLGYLIIDSRNAGKRYDLVVAGMLLIGVIGLGLDILIRRLERARAVRWGFRNES